MDEKTIFGALIGLAGAINNNGKSENTDFAVCEALLSSDTQKAVDIIHKEKFAISPSCETCSSPCGNTSDFDMERLKGESADIYNLKMQIMEELKKIAGRYDGASKPVLPDGFYKAISYLGYELKKESYEELLMETKTW